LHLQGYSYPLVASVAAVAGVILGALYMLYFAQRFLFGAAKAPHQPLFDLNLREKSILVAIVAGVFALGLFPDEAMHKTELAAQQYRRLVAEERIGAPVASRDARSTVARADAVTQGARSDAPGSAR
jgi:NADH-quinone oxidoreductase subunit M